MTKEESTKVVNFMTPWIWVVLLRCGHIGHLVKLHFFFSSCKHWGMDQTNFYMVMKTKEGLKNYKFYEPRGRGSSAGHEPIVKMQCFFSSCIHWIMDEKN